MARAKPTAEQLQQLRSGKARWRRDQMSLPMREKVRILLELQRQEYPLLKARRTLEWWERPWEVEP